MTETPSSTVISTKLERIAKLAKERPGIALTTLAHHIDIEWLREAYRRTLQSRSEAASRRAGCGKAARPDLSGLGVCVLG
jgi:hypothetical protein